MRTRILNMHPHSMQEIIMGFPPTLEGLIMNAPKVKWLTFVVSVSVCDCQCQCHVAHNVVHYGLSCAGKSAQYAYIHAFVSVFASVPDHLYLGVRFISAFYTCACQCEHYRSFGSS